MAATIKGIRANFAGKCSLCGNEWYEGDLIEKIPDTDPIKRGHAGCVANLGSRRPGPQPRDNNGGGNGNGTTTARQPNPDLERFATAEQYWDASAAMTDFAKAAMKAANAFQHLAQQIDPHHVKDRTSRE